MVLLDSYRQAEATQTSAGIKMGLTWLATLTTLSWVPSWRINLLVHFSLVEMIKRCVRDSFPWPQINIALNICLTLAPFRSITKEIRQLDHQVWLVPKFIYSRFLWRVIRWIVIWTHPLPWTKGRLFSWEDFCVSLSWTISSNYEDYMWGSYVSRWDDAFEGLDSDYLHRLS